MDGLQAALEESSPLSEEEAIRLRHQGEHDEIILSCLRLSAKIAHSFRHKTRLDIDDLLGIANLATVEAINNWQDGWNLKAWVILKVQEALRKSLRSTPLFKLPDNTWGQLKELKNYINGNERLSSSQLAVMMGKSEERVVELLDVNQRLIIQSLIPHINQLSNDDNCMEIAPGIFPCLAAVERMLSGIDDKFMVECFSRKHGLNGFKVHSFVKLAKVMRRSKDYVEYQVVVCTKLLRREVDPGWSDSSKCKQCGDTFEYSPNSHGHQKFCSKRCSRLSRQKKYDAIPCDWCDEPFRPKKKSEKFCSKKCRVKREIQRNKERRYDKTKTQCDPETPQRKNGAKRHDYLSTL